MIIFIINIILLAYGARLIEELPRSFFSGSAELRSRRLEIVPFFVADGKYAVSGAQSPEVLLELLQRAYDDASQLTPVAAMTDSSSEASCDGDSCAAG